MQRGAKGCKGCKGMQRDAKECKGMQRDAKGCKGWVYDKGTITERRRKAGAKEAPRRRKASAKATHCNIYSFGAPPPCPP